MPVRYDGTESSGTVISVVVPCNLIWQLMGADSITSILYSCWRLVSRSSTAPLYGPGGSSACYRSRHRLYPSGFLDGAHHPILQVRLNKTRRPPCGIETLRLQNVSNAVPSRGGPRPAGPTRGLPARHTAGPTKPGRLPKGPQHGASQLDQTPVEAQPRNLNRPRRTPQGNPPPPLTSTRPPAQETTPSPARTANSLRAPHETFPAENPPGPDKQAGASDYAARAHLGEPADPQSGHNWLGLSGALPRKPLLPCSPPRSGSRAERACTRPLRSAVRANNGRPAEGPPTHGASTQRPQVWTAPTYALPALIAAAAG